MGNNNNNIYWEVWLKLNDVKMIKMMMIGGDTVPFLRKTLNFSV